MATSPCIVGAAKSSVYAELGGAQSLYDEIGMTKKIIERFRAVHR